jgi:molybdopterin synthase sulfur carrier subunit
VRVSNPLRSLTGGVGELRVPAATLAELFEAVDSAHPGFSERVRDEQGRLRNYVNAFVGDVESRHLAGMETPLSPGSVVTVVAAVAGG